MYLDLGILALDSRESDSIEVIRHLETQHSHPLDLLHQSNHGRGEVGTQPTILILGQHRNLHIHRELTTVPDIV